MRNAELSADAQPVSWKTFVQEMPAGQTGSKMESRLTGRFRIYVW